MLTIQRSYSRIGSTRACKLYISEPWEATMCYYDDTFPDDSIRNPIVSEKLNVMEKSLRKAYHKNRPTDKDTFFDFLDDVAKGIGSIVEVEVEEDQEL